MTNLKIPKRLQGVKKAAHARSPKQENEIAKHLGGKRVKGSGSGFDKGDVRVKGIALIEAKCTEKNSFSVTRDMVEKLENAAASQGELPVLTVEFLGDDRGRGRKELVVMPKWALEMLRGK